MHRSTQQERAGRSTDCSAGRQQGTVWDLCIRKWRNSQHVVCAAAYEVLSEPEKRKIYDRYGEEGLKEHEGRGGRGGGGGAQDIFSQCATRRSTCQLGDRFPAFALQLRNVSRKQPASRPIWRSLAGPESAQSALHEQSPVQ